MAFEDLRDTVKESFGQLVSRVQESSAYAQFNEKFQSLSPDAQKVAIATSALMAVLVLLMIPYLIAFSYSQDDVADFESKRALIKEVFQVSREARGLPPPPPQVSSGQLQSSAQSILQGARLQGEQMGGVSEIADIKVPGIPTTTVQSAGVSVSLTKLNLTQVIEIGAQLQNMHEMARMIGVDIKANAQDGHYFDVVYKIAAFSAKPEPAAGGAGRNRSRPRSAGAGADAE